MTALGKNPTRVRQWTFEIKSKLKKLRATVCQHRHPEPVKAQASH